ncbi:MAG: RNA polymerase sigma factor SigB, partial [uncultured Solirubrobacteraceae bacterium]
ADTPPADSGSSGRASVRGAGPGLATRSRRPSAGVRARRAARLTRPCRRGPPAAAALPPARRSGGARGAGAAHAASGPADGPPLSPLRRVLRRPRPGGHRRPHQGDRPLRPGTCDRLLVLRGADHARRAEALLPRQRLGGSRAARHAGARHARRRDHAGSVTDAGALAGRRRSRRRPLHRARAGTGGDGGGFGLRRGLAGGLPLRRRRRRGDLRRLDRRRRRPLRDGRVRRDDRTDPGRAPGARPHGAAPALRRRPHAGRDRRARRRLADARLAPDPPGARAAADRRRARRL